MSSSPSSGSAGDELIIRKFYDYDIPISNSQL
jgi:hypothetical protein